MARFKRGLLETADRHRKAARLGDMAAQGIGIFCWCNRCGHNGELATRFLLARLGPGFPVPDVGARLRCRGCGSKDIATRPAWRGLGQVARHDPCDVTPAPEPDASSPTEP